MMSNKNWEIIHIPGTLPLLPAHQPTVNVYASEIDPKLANNLVRRLNQIAPLEDLRHVKRVRKRCLEGETQLLVILCLASEEDGEFDNMPKDVLELTHTYQLNAFVTQVCKYAAVSKEEWEEQCKLWPTSFHPPTYNIEGVGGFSDEDSRIIYKFMELALQLSISANDQICNAAVIVDPSLKKVIATACDEIYSWNAALDRNRTGKHSVMPAEVVASHAVNGFSSYVHCQSKGSASRHKGVSVGASCLNPWQWSHIQSALSSSSYWHPLRHAAMVAIECSAARDRHLFPDNGQACEHSCEMDVCAIADSPAMKTKPDEIADGVNGATKSSRPYLCTGYDIYLAWEPCVITLMVPTCFQVCHGTRPSKSSAYILCFSESKYWCIGKRPPTTGSEKLKPSLCCFQSCTTPLRSDGKYQTSLTVTPAKA